jgi:hypothetical protein
MAIEPEKRTTDEVAAIENSERKGSFKLEKSTSMYEEKQSHERRTDRIPV